MATVLHRPQHPRISDPMKPLYTCQDACMKSFIIKPQFDDSRVFSGDLCSVEVCGTWGYIKNPLE